MSGVVRRVDGPLIQAEGLAGVAVADLLEVGRDRLPAEVVGVRQATITAQVYEYTGGVAPGDPVLALHRPLAVSLGPGLLGGVFDGLLRPLSGASTWLSPGNALATASGQWHFTPESPGRGVLGTVAGAGAVPHRVLLPQDLADDPVTFLAPEGLYGPEDLIATVGGKPVTLFSWWPVRRPRPFVRRLELGAPLLTGQRVLDAVFPVVKGSSAAVPGGFGTGKTVLLQQIAKWCDADVIVYVGCGERGNELADVLAELSELTDPRTGGRLADRTIIIANTSNMPIMAREASIYTGVTVAEYYRDMGYDAVVIADSTSRWAEALREFASRSGALPAEEGYPARLASALAAFYERAGRVLTNADGTGSVTIIGAVSPPGGDMTEPVTAHTERFVRTLWTLDRDLAYARHYPAVTWTGSYCRDADVVGAWAVGQGDAGWATRRAQMVSLLAEADRLGQLAELVGAASLPGHERMVMLAGRLLREGVLRQSALSDNDSYCTPAKAAALIDAILAIHARCEELVGNGMLAATVETADFTPILRAAEETAPGDVAGVRCRWETTLKELEALP